MAKPFGNFYFCSTHSSKFWGAFDHLGGGGSPQIEYGGPASSKNKNILGREWLEEFGGLLGNRASDMLGVNGITEKICFYILIQVMKNFKE